MNKRAGRIHKEQGQLLRSCCLNVSLLLGHFIKPRVASLKYVAMKLEYKHYSMRRHETRALSRLRTDPALPCMLEPLYVVYRHSILVDSREKTYPASLSRNDWRTWVSLRHPSISSHDVGHPSLFFFRIWPGARDVVAVRVYTYDRDL